MHDVIGGVHGHADELRRLLSAMGYAERGGCWRHRDRRAVWDQEGRLCAYRWDGESVLRPEGFVSVGARPAR